MRVSSLLIVLLVAGCHGGNRSSESTARRLAMDSTTARRICQAPDSVIAGTKDCVLLDQGVRGREVRPPTRSPRE